MEKLSGRISEKKSLLKVLNSGRPELIAVIGRRRVGKTFLVRNVLGKNINLEFSGEHSGKMKTQLLNFHLALKEYSKDRFITATPANWTEAFESLKKYLVSLKKISRKVVFIDEFPWIETRKSGFLSAFEHFWNSWGTKQDDLVIVICGSSASWMIKNIVNNRGGLHNRLTLTLRLEPFTLPETEEFLISKKIMLDRYQIVQLYMVTGGIPFYLTSIQRGESVVQYIDRICFTKDGLLLKEFDNLYKSLFKLAAKHIELVKILANHPGGLTRDKLVSLTGNSSGGRFSETLSELEESGFIASYIPFGVEKKNKLFRLNDEFSFFYLKFMGQALSPGQGTWMKISAKPVWKIWSGYSWERICMRHTIQIKSALGISGIHSVTGTWRKKGDSKSTGSQIDLYIDRDDHCINICEIKFVDSEFIITKSYAEDLKLKIRNFREATRTKKTLLLTFLTTFGLKENEYSTSLVQKILELDDLFSRNA